MFVEDIHVGLRVEDVVLDGNGTSKRVGDAFDLAAEGKPGA